MANEANAVVDPITGYYELGASLCGIAPDVVNSQSTTYSQLYSASDRHWPAGDLVMWQAC